MLIYIISSLFMVAFVILVCHYFYQKGVNEGVNEGRKQILEENIIRAEHESNFLKKEYSHV